MFNRRFRSQAVGQCGSEYARACSTLRIGWGLHGFWLQSGGREVWWQLCRFGKRQLAHCIQEVARSGGVRGPLSRRNNWNAALWVPLRGLWQCKRACIAKVCVAVVSRSVFLSGQAAKKNYEHPWHARGHNLAEIASTHMLLRGPSPPPSRKTGPSCTNDRFHSS